MAIIYVGIGVALGIVLIVLAKWISRTRPAQHDRLMPVVKRPDTQEYAQGGSPATHPDAHPDAHPDVRIVFETSNHRLRIKYPHPLRLIWAVVEWAMFLVLMALLVWVLGEIIIHHLFPALDHNAVSQLLVRLAQGETHFVARFTHKK